MAYNCELWDNTEITKSAEYQAQRQRNVIEVDREPQGDRSKK